jgi:predicted helicase
MTLFVGAYLAEVQKHLGRGDATEHTLRPALVGLFQSSGKGIVATNEPKHLPLIGAPDLKVSRGRIPLGNVETKPVGVDLAEMERGKGPYGDQFIRYSALPNWMLTDYLEFRWFTHGERRRVVRVAEVVGKNRLKSLADAEQQLTELIESFIHCPALTVGTAKQLADSIAGYARTLQQQTVVALQQESAGGWLHQWLKAFQQTLIPDLDEKKFSDMFAQTLAYGLFAARVHTPANEDFTRDSAARTIPRTNPFLQQLFYEITGPKLPDSIAWVMESIVELLNHANMPEILKGFGKGKGKLDPVVHFYETFLAAYDPKMREVRGVYYTPEPVVSYIVRSVDHLLKTRFNRSKGLADENTLILDPATGTATFLYFVVNLIHEKFARQKGAWDGYVRDHLLNRVFGFELLIAPYAIAHLKLGMQLADLGYKFGTDQRLGIYLTNTLEEAAKKSEQLFAGWIADEANAAAKIKQDEPIMVVLGNPPYSGISANRSRNENGELTFIGKLIEDYKWVDGQPLDERKHWLQDDYVKFIRFAEWRINQTGEGIISLITNHGYLDNPTFRGMRRHLMQTFGEIFVLNLHGSTKKKDVAPGGGRDENVFDIQQGVAIVLCVKVRSEKKAAQVCYADLWGERKSKYEALNSTDLAVTDWKKLNPTSPFYFFVPHCAGLKSEYEKGWQVTDIFPVNGVGAVMGRESLTVGFDQDELWKQLQEFTSLSAEEARLRFKLGEDARDWKVETAQADLESFGLIKKKILPLLYRPFDFRWTYYTGKSKGFYASACANVLSHFLARKNLGLITSRSVEIGRFEHALCTQSIIGHHSVSMKEVNYLFPLYLHDDAETNSKKGGGTMLMALFEPSAGYSARRANLDPKFIQELTQRLGLKWIPLDRGDLKKTIGPEDVFNYTYAVFHSPTYRGRYAEFLKIDFPRLPLTSDLKMFRALAAKGAELVALHLMESPKLNNYHTTFPLKGDDIVEKVQYTDSDQRVWISAKQYFGGVPKAAWEFHVGGYQVCERWLKDRKGRKLTYRDIQHYQKVIVSLSETSRLMREIDERIPNWPIE